MISNIILLITLGCVCVCSFKTVTVSVCFSSVDPPSELLIMLLTTNKMAQVCSTYTTSCELSSSHAHGYTSLFTMFGNIFEDFDSARSSASMFDWTPHNFCNYRALTTAMIVFCLKNCCLSDMVLCITNLVLCYSV